MEIFVSGYVYLKIRLCITVEYAWNHIQKFFLKKIKNVFMHNQQKGPSSICYMGFRV